MYKFTKNFIASTISIGMLSLPFTANTAEYHSFGDADTNLSDVEVSYRIILPDSYETEPNKYYPTFYWLHGKGGDIDLPSFDEKFIETYALPQYW